MSRGAESTIGAKLELSTTNSPAVSRIKDACQEDLKCATMSMLWLQHMLRHRSGYGVTHEHVMNCSGAITAEWQQLTWKVVFPQTARRCALHSVRSVAVASPIWDNPASSRQADDIQGLRNYMCWRGNKDSDSRGRLVRDRRTDP